MQPHISDRDDAIRMLCEAIELASAAHGTAVMLRLLWWVERRDERDGGFLWLASVVGYRPAKLADMILSTLYAPPRRRQAIIRKLQRLRGEAS